MMCVLKSSVERSFEDLMEIKMLFWYGQTVCYEPSNYIVWTSFQVASRDSICRSLNIPNLPRSASYVLEYIVHHTAFIASPFHFLKWRCQWCSMGEELNYKSHSLTLTPLNIRHAEMLWTLLFNTSPLSVSISRWNSCSHRDWNLASLSGNR